MTSRHYPGLANISRSKPTAVTIGVFDGLHLGHQQLIRQLVKIAHTARCESAVLTFHPHPDTVVRGKTGPFYLTTPEERAKLLFNLGVDMVITQAFDETLSRMSAKEFIQQLCIRLQLKTLVLGDGFALGHQRRGDLSQLQALGEQMGYQVVAVQIKKTGERAIRSQAIRDALLKGAVEYVRDELLGRPYSLRGLIVPGRQRGRKLGFPTANLQVWEQKLIPSQGIYAGWTTLGEKRYMALIYLGKRPSFHEREETVEVYLVDFAEEIYGDYLTISFEKFLRPDERFADVSNLRRQIERDVKRGIRYLRERSESGKR